MNDGMGNSVYSAESTKLYGRDGRGRGPGGPQIAGPAGPHILIRSFTLEFLEGHLRRLPRRRIFPAEAEAREGEPAAIYRPDHSDRGRDSGLLVLLAGNRGGRRLGTNLILG